MTHANSSNYDPSPSLPSEVTSIGMSPTPTPCDAQSTSNYPSTSCSAASSLLSTDDHPPTPLNLCLLTPVKPHPHSTARNDTFDADRSALTSLHPHQTTSYCKSQPSAEPIGTLASSSNASLSGVAFSLNDDTEGVTHGHIQLSANDRDMGMLEGCGGDEDVGLTQETDPVSLPPSTAPAGCSEGLNISFLCTRHLTLSLTLLIISTNTRKLPSPRALTCTSVPWLR
jgi:hypothetical protein